MVKEYKTIADYRPKAHNPAPPLDNITFRKVNILGKDVYVSPKSKLVVAKKLPKKSASVIGTYEFAKLADGIKCYTDEVKLRKKGQSLYLLIHTDELDHEQLIDKKEG